MYHYKNLSFEIQDDTLVIDNPTLVARMSINNLLVDVKKLFDITLEVKYANNQATIKNFKDIDFNKLGITSS